MKDVKRLLDGSSSLTTITIVDGPIEIDRPTLELLREPRTPVSFSFEADDDLLKLTTQAVLRSLRWSILMLMTILIWRMVDRG